MACLLLLKPSLVFGVLKCFLVLQFPGFDPGSCTHVSDCSNTVQVCLPEFWIPLQGLSYALVSSNSLDDVHVTPRDVLVYPTTERDTTWQTNVHDAIYCTNDIIVGSPSASVKKTGRHANWLAERSSTFNFQPFNFHLKWTPCAPLFI